MPIIFQTQICRADLRLNPSCLYLFGDNDLRQGLGGQARAMRGEPNAIGIRTKAKPSLAPDSFYYEGEGPGKNPAAFYIAKVESDFAPVRIALGRGVIVIVPAAGLGTGAARLSVTAPKTFAYLESIIARITRGRFEVPDSPN